MKRRLFIFSIAALAFAACLITGAVAQQNSSIVGTWQGNDQSHWRVSLIFRDDGILRVMLRENTWDTPYKIDVSKNPATIDIDDFRSVPVTGVDRRDYRMKETTFLGIIRFVDKDTIMLEGYNGKGRPTSFSNNAITLKRQ